MLVLQDFIRIIILVLPDFIRVNRIHVYRFIEDNKNNNEKKCNQQNHYCKNLNQNYHLRSK